MAVGIAVGAGIAAAGCFLRRQTGANRSRAHSYTCSGPRTYARASASANPCSCAYNTDCDSAYNTDCDSHGRNTADTAHSGGPQRLSDVP